LTDLPLSWIVVLVEPIRRHYQETFMGKQDEVDEERAQRYAWRLKPDLPEDDAGASHEPDSAAAQRDRREVNELCQQLANSIQLVWALGPGEAQVEALPALLEQAERLGIRAAAMSRLRIEPIRFGRLLARWWRRLPPELAEEAAHVLTWMDLRGHPETVDLLCEVVRAENGWLAYCVEQAALDEHAWTQLPTLGSRLADLLDTAPTLRMRDRAARWLTFGHWPEAVPALRRALFTRSLSVRASALHALEYFDPPQVTPSELQRLLDDAVLHPPIPSFLQDRETAYDTGREYEALLVRAVGRLRPLGGLEPLHRILHGDVPHVKGYREFLGVTFALRALAAGYPDQALVPLDRGLRAASHYDRDHALDAALELPDDLLRPRLLAAAGDPAAPVSERARKLWLERFGTPCPADRDADLCTVLLPASRSEAFAGRLLVLRTGSEEARQAMLAALLTEAPDLEVLVLIFHAFSDESLVIRDPGQPTLPRGTRAWMDVLVERFGPAAWDGLLWLTERFPWGRGSWISELEHRVQQGQVPEDRRPRLREIAGALVASEQLRDADYAWPRILGYLGGPEALLDRLLELALGRVAGASRNLPFWATTVLKTYPGAPALTARLLPLLAETGDPTAFYTLASLALDLGLQEALEVIAAGLANAPAPGLSGHARFLESHVTAQLRDRGRLPPGFVEDALVRPESLRFDLVVGILRPADIATDGPLREALERALASEVRDGTAAALAASRLLDEALLAPDDPRVLALLDRCSPTAAVPLLQALICTDLPVARHRAHLESAIVEAAGDAAYELVNTFLLRRPEGYLELFEAVYPRVTEPRCRRAIEAECGLESEAETYWTEPEEDPDE
jgi:hypothetical protein